MVRPLTSEELSDCCGGCRTNSAIETWMQRAIAKFCEVNGIQLGTLGVAACGAPLAVAEVRVEQDYWNRGHFYKGRRKTLVVTTDLEQLPVGTKLYAELPVGVMASGEVQAWQHEEDPARVISAIQKAQAERDGGASASSVKPYSVSLTRGVTASRREPQ